MANNYNQFYQRHLEHLQKVAEEAINAAYKEAFTEYIKNLEPIINKMFERVAMAFYNDYDPRYYNRRHSLYDIMNTSADENSMTISFDHSKPVSRSGKSLYELVFKEGWHGGAETGKGHPYPGTPYYRGPRDYYNHWMKSRDGLTIAVRYDGEAARAEISPYEDMYKRVREYESKQLDKEFTKILNEKIKNIDIRW